MNQYRELDTTCADGHSVYKYANQKEIVCNVLSQNLLVFIVAEHSKYANVSLGIEPGLPV